MVSATRNSTFGNPGTGSSRTPQGTEGEAHAGGHHEQPRDLPPPPPPENLTMPQFLQALREERQASNAAIQQLTQVLVDNPPRNEYGGGRSTLSEFMRTTPPYSRSRLNPWTPMTGFAPLKTSLRWSSAPMIMRRSFMLLTVSEAPPEHGGMDSRSCG